jgi:GDPmannose 4,6-dehydratase
VSVKSPRTLITGIAGQDGSYLAELLLAEGADVHGALRGPLPRDLPNLAAVREQITLHEADVEVPGQLRQLVAESEPDEIYHLAAPAFVPDSWREPARTARAVVGGGAELLEAMRDHAPRAHVVIASSREVFGASAPSPQDETTPCSPTSPYGICKLAVHQLVGLARERDGLHASSAILFNHESPRRDPTFISRKVTRGVAEIKLGRATELVLGDLAATRDWSAARDIVRGMRAMARAEEPADYVLASGHGRTVRELVDTAFAAAGLEAAPYLRFDERFMRPPEHSETVGNARRAASQLGWSPQTTFEELIAEMVDADLRLIAGEVDDLSSTRR